MLDNIKVIYFDMGNTLLHFHYGDSDEEKDMVGLHKLTKYLNQFHSEVSFKNVKEGFYNKWMSIMNLRKETLIEYPIEEFLNEFLKTYDVYLTINQCIEAINIFYDEYKRQLHFEKNLRDTLIKIKEKGYKIGVISNTCYYDEVMIDCFKVSNLYELIDDFTFSYSLKLCKPREEIFKKALEKMNICGKDAVMVGDNLKCDIKPALDLGMKTIWLNKSQGKNHTEIKPHIIISNLHEINEFI